MSEPRSQEIQLSEDASFSVGDVQDNPAKKKISFFYKDDKQYRQTLMSKTTPKLEDVKPNEIVMVLEDKQLRAYWVEDGALNNGSFPESAVKDIAKILPKVGEISTNLDLIQKITSKYGCIQHNSMMLATAPPFPPNEYPMQYDEAKKQWFVEIERSRDAAENFTISTAKVVGDPRNKDAPALQSGFIALKDGKQQPVNINPRVPKGEVKPYLYTREGKIIGPVDKKELELKEGQRIIKIYFPTDYNEHRKPPYNVQINLDGGQYLDIMKMDAILDNLIDAKQIDPVVAVFISPYVGPPDAKKPGSGSILPPGYSFDMRSKEYSCNPEFAEQLANLPSMMRKQFNITDDPTHTTLCGLSLGGLQAAYTALLFPDVIGNVIGQSPAAAWGPLGEGIAITEDPDTWGSPLDSKEKEYLKRTVEESMSKPDKRSGKIIKPSSLKFYFEAGDKETGNPEHKIANLKAATENLSVALMSKGHTVIYSTFSGDHSPDDWVKGIPDAEIMIHSIVPRRDSVMVPASDVPIEDMRLKEKDKKQSSSAMIASAAGINLLLPTPVPSQAPVAVEKKKVEQKQLHKDTGVDVTRKKMARSAFGQGSHTAKKHSKR